MADVQPLRALHYDLGVVGSLGVVAAPPYDVIGPEQREQLAARSPYNVVSLDLPVAPDGADPYAHAARLLERFEREGALVRDEQPAIWALTQDYTAPDGARRTRRGFFARIGIEDYGPGKIRPHERTHPGPKEDRLRLTRATRTNLSPIFVLYPDPEGSAWGAIEPALAAEPWGELDDDEGTAQRIWRIADEHTIEAVAAALRDAELLIADGHHRYETARVYADEVGGDGEHRHVLACLVALEDPGLTVFPTHRLVRGLAPDRHERLAEAIRRDFELEEVAPEAIEPPPGGPPLELGYIDAHFRRAFRLKLKDQAIADRRLAGHPDAYRALDAAVVEALLLKDALGLTDDDIDHLHGFGYARDREQALELVLRGEFDAAFVLRPTPIEQVRAVAAGGASMPPKSTYFFPKIPTGLVFNPLS